jgi:hypothetical protein
MIWTVTAVTYARKISDSSFFLYASLSDLPLLRASLSDSGDNR